MDRYDFIETQEDIVSNIRTLYSYLQGEQGDEYKSWAIEKMIRGKNYVVEIIDSMICFAPSRFVGYLNNSKEKHEENHGDGTQTDEKIKAYYKKVQDERLDLLFQNELSKYGVSSNQKKYWISNDITVDDIIRISRNKTKYTPQNVDFDKYWHIQMHLPEGKGGTPIDSTLMLLEPEPVIGTGEWDDGQCKNFKNIDNGNIVLVRKGNQAIALCQIIGKNFTDANLTAKYINGNFRKVKILSWADNYKQPQPKLFSQGTFSSCKKNTKQYKYIKDWLAYMNNKAFTDKCANLLRSKHNIILQGAPGTGKTYNTAAIALDVLGVSDVDLTDHVAVMNRYNELLDNRIFFTTFHQSLDYEDFVEGLKPHVQANANGDSIGVTYEPEDGIFKRACSAVVTDESKDIIECIDEAVKKEYNAKADKSVVLIIDEINRGNVSKIFGELITLLESDKRDKGHHPLKVLLPYSKTLFSVPSNLYIIGTMNTTDRSTGTLDYALRRRFAFVTLQSNPDVIEKHYDKLNNQELKIKAIGLFNDIKSFIMNPKHQCGDFGVDDLMVGHSYFMASSEDELANKVEFEILPLIAEYISDGIINVSNEEKTKAFQAWSNLQPMQVVEEAADAEDDSLI